MAFQGLLLQFHANFIELSEISIVFFFSPHTCPICMNWVGSSIAVVIPPNSNTFSDWRRTCHVSLVKTSWRSRATTTWTFDSHVIRSSTFVFALVRVSGKQNSLFPLGPVIKCLLTTRLTGCRVVECKKEVSFTAGSRTAKRSCKYLGGSWRSDQVVRTRQLKSRPDYLNCQVVRER